VLKEELCLRLLEANLIRKRDKRERRERRNVEIIKKQKLKL